MAAPSSSQSHQAHLLTSLLSSLSPPFSDSHLHSLALVLSPSLLLDALDLIDRDRVSRLSPPANRPIYQVASSSGGVPYTVYPATGEAASFRGSAGGGYCPCPAFSRGVLAGDGVICKHLLAVLLSLRLSPPSPPNSASPSSPTKLPPPRSAFVEKRVTLEWLAGYATKFGAAVPGSGNRGARETGGAG